MNLQDAIQGKGLKQGWVAARLGIRKDSFSRMVHGETRFPIEKVTTLAGLLDMPIDQALAMLAKPFEQSESVPQQKD